MKTQFQEFVDFIRKQGVVGLAVGFILGGAISAVVASIVNNLINPLLGLLLGQAKSLTSASFSIFEAQINYGKFLNDVINFIVIAGVVFFGVKRLELDKMDKPKE